MKILLLQHYEMDYNGAGITQGLLRTPGIDVYEWPYVEHHHGGVDTGYELPGEGPIGVTAPTPFLYPIVPGIHRTYEEIFDHLSQFDWIVAHSTRRTVIESLYEIKKTLGHNPRNLILVCGEDHSILPIEVIGEFQPVVSFKRELLRLSSAFNPFRYSKVCQVWPLQFAAFTYAVDHVLAHANTEEKNFDFFLSLGRTHQCRDILLSKCLDYVTHYNKYKFWIATNTNSPLVHSHPHGHLLQGITDWNSYMVRQAKSKVTCSIRGYGRDALHAWEAFSSGTSVLYADPGLYIPHPFIDGKHCLYFQENSSDVEEKLDILLNDEGQRQFLAKSGKDHCYKHHSIYARVFYMLDIATKIRQNEVITPEEFSL